MENEVNELLDYGIINLDKPIGPTSHKTVEYARKILGVKKAGHSGTLDPKVSGVLPIALGKATRVLEVLLALPKEYVGVMHLHEDVGLRKINSVIKNKFLGKIKQTPPRKSAVKRAEREREVYEFKILEKQGKDILFKVKGQAGLYIRKLIHDLGQELKGAHMLELRRTAVGNFSEKECITLYGLQKAVLGNNLEKVIHPMEQAIKQLPHIKVDKAELEKLKDGKSLNLGTRKIKVSEKDFIALTYKDKLVALVKLKPKEKLLKPEKVFRERIFKMAFAYVII